jgi:hypothetical protein
VLAPGGEATFAIRFDAGASASGGLSFANSDASENPFNFTISGVVAPVRIFDNGDSVFSTVGNWEPFDGQGFQNDVHFSAAGTGADVASWTIPVSPGQYRVAVTWSTHLNRATDARFTVLNGGTELATININQELPPAGAAPDGVTDAGFTWQFLGGIHNITGNTLVIRLTDLANEYVIADAVRIERIGNLPETDPGSRESAEVSAAPQAFFAMLAAPATDEVALVGPADDARATEELLASQPPAAVLAVAAEKPTAGSGPVGLETSFDEEDLFIEHVVDLLDDRTMDPDLVDAVLAADDWS